MFFGSITESFGLLNRSIIIVIRDDECVIKLKYDLTKTLRRSINLAITFAESVENLFSFPTFIKRSALAAGFDVFFVRRKFRS